MKGRRNYIILHLIIFLFCTFSLGENPRGFNELLLLTPDSFSNRECSESDFSNIDSCLNTEAFLYSALKNTVEIIPQNNFRFDWYQCTDEGFFRIFFWEDDNGFPGEVVHTYAPMVVFPEGWNHITFPAASFPSTENLWVGIQDYTGTQEMGMDTDEEGCSAVFIEGSWEELSGGNLAYKLTNCLEDNPAGCFQTGCPDDYVCIDDWENDCVSSYCDCDESSGGWVCDADCNGGTCALMGCMDSTACNFNPDASVDDGSCSYVFDCANICGGTSVEDICGMCGGIATMEEHCLEMKCNLEMASYYTFGQCASDITGYHQDGREFAAVGLVEDVAAFMDITDPENPIEVGRLHGTANIWRDLKYWNRHVYIGTEAEDGVRVVSVDDPDNPLLVHTITDFLDSHNIHIDANGFLYVIGSADYALLIYDLTNPALPELIGSWNDEYLHDIEVYNNKLYGAGIYSGQFYIIDVSDKTNPITVLNHYTGLEGISTHDCAVTEDEQILITADETVGGHIKIWDISDYENINLLSEYMTHPEHSMHNVYIRPGTNLVIMSYYVDGTRVLDISDPTNPIEVGYFDTSNGSGLYDGNWGTYAYLPSGYIISSDRENGLFIFDSPLTNSSMEWSDCSIIQGDVNYDGELNILDIVKVVNFILDIDEFTEIQYSLADMNLDELIDILDLILLSNAILDQR